MSKMTLSSEVYQQILEGILQGFYLPGDRLKVLPLKERYSCTASPLREALFSLQESAELLKHDHHLL